MTIKENKNSQKHLERQIDQFLGQRLKLQRQICGFSQEKLGEAVGLTFQQVQKYESGTNRMAASRLYQFSKILSIPIQYFFADAEVTLGLAEPEQQDYYAGFEYDPEVKRLIQAYYRITDMDIKKSILKMVTRLADAEHSRDDSDTVL